MTELLIVAGFAIVWIATFKLAWRLLIRLVIRASEPDFRLSDGRFWLDFILYRLVILLPYLVPLIFAQRLPDIVVQLIWAWIGLGIILSFGRIFGVKRLMAGLWQVYGLVYDGLLNLYPYRHLLELTYQRLDVRSGQAVLDVGCGSGNLLKLIQEKGVSDVSLTGVDDSSTMLKRAKRKLDTGVTLERSELMAFLGQQSPASFDRIALVNVAYAVPNRTELWSQCLRVLKPGGRIVMTTSIAPGSGVIIKEHLQHDHWWKLLHPQLLAVGLVDVLISELSRTSVFEFPPRQQLLAEIERAGGSTGEVERCYGGRQKGVNIICTITHLTP